jgi:hypothetical protein
MSYANLFKKTLLKEESPSIRPTTNVSTSRHSPISTPSQESDFGSDEDAWNANNPDIIDNDELLSQFNVDGLDRDEVEKYSEIIAQWGQGIQTAIDQLAQIVKFAAGEKLANAPGSEQFSTLIKDAPRLKSDLSAFRSQVEDLAETVKLAINDAATERRNKVDDLRR